MPAIILTPTQRKEHRAAAHHLHPVVMIGGDGLTPAVVQEADRALKAHGLIKVRVFSDERQDRETMLAQLADQLDAAPIQHIGKLLVLWRPLPAEPAPPPRAERGAGTRLVKVVQAAKMEGRRPVVKMVKLLGNERVTAGGHIKRVKARATPSIKKRVG
jgi:RNA-binding protein